MFALLVILSSMVSQYQAEDNLIFLSAERLPDLNEYKFVYKIDMAANTVASIYTSPLAVRNVSRATGAERLIVHAVDTTSGYTEVNVIDLQGNMIRILAGAVSAVFIDASGNRIAYTKGFVNDDLRTISQGTWLFDFETNQELQICEAGLYLEWVPLNNSLYISNSGEGGDGFLYNIESEELEASDLQFG